MKKSTIGFGFAAAFVAGFAALMTASTPAIAENTKLTIHNATGTDVDVAVFEDDSPNHRDSKGGISAGHIKDGESASATVKTCKFAIVLKHGDDIYHGEFHDCKVTDITITNKNK
jgi:hypothetical protein